MPMQRIALPRKILTFPGDQLKKRVRPGAGITHEAIPHVLYDTQTYLAAGVAAGRLTFFGAVNADATLSNMSLAGMLEQGQFFDLYAVCLDAMVAGSNNVAATAAGVLNDLDIIVRAQRATFTFNILSKPIGPIPATLLGRTGGAEGTTAGNAGAAAINQFGNFAGNGGWPVNGSIRIGGTYKFGAFLDFALPVGAVSRDTPLRLSLVGVLYRPIA